MSVWVKYFIIIKELPQTDRKIEIITMRSLCMGLLLFVGVGEAGPLRDIVSLDTKVSVWGNYFIKDNILHPNGHFCGHPTHRPMCHLPVGHSSRIAIWQQCLHFGDGEISYVICQKKSNTLYITHQKSSHLFLYYLIFD